MDAMSPWPSLAVTLAGFGTAWAMSRFGPRPLPQGRFDSIDGLRGYLALFVFIHHAGVWYFYLRTGQWRVPPSNLYTQFGQASVALFFMITGLLFFSKLLNSRVTPIDWTRLYVGRVLRLAPLYLTVMGALFVVVGILSGGSLREPATTLAKSAVKWLGFTVLGHPDLNGVDRTSTILAGVTWSLPYEWFFYLALPALGLLAGLRVPRAFAALSVCSLIGLVAWKPGPIHLAAFLGGLAAALAVRSARFRRLCTGRGASAATLVTLGTLVTCFDTAYHPAALLLLGGAFCLVAGGCTVFGLLTLDASRRLGEVTYGVYLLHGLTLFVVFRCVLGFEAAAALSSLGYWGLVVALTPILVLLCFIAFRTIEEPAMRRTQLVTQRLKSAASRRPSIHPH